MQKAWIVAAVILVVVLGLKMLERSRGFTGFLGERGIQSRLNELDPSKYHVMNNLLVPNAKGDGTSQIDHLVVFGGGVAVIETKNWAGRVFGKGQDRRWTVVLGRRKYRPENPILQNQGHIKAVLAIVREDIPVHNIVVLGRRADLRLNDIKNASVIRPQDVVPLIRNLNNDVLSDEQVHTVYRRLADMNIQDSGARKQHIQYVKRLRK
ncbi:nuclease-related domain-containing protein [Alicyclobacillus sp.]|uniref:nuclease-related domain-containing protein n=1 Tax=Alicyclobacillus sp. TaxID=61169 RepID=UPI0025BD3A3F|nr:nuclease-related domain-containing protein [Alicyclobacillus sp.]MCL6518054.1 NERD domain-containing protein [Alicyclobacillus sp.]